jgi:hypothetical protein
MQDAPDDQPDEFFYQITQAADVDLGGGYRLKVYEDAMEGAYANGAPEKGQEMVFNRFRCVIDCPDLPATRTCMAVCAACHNLLWLACNAATARSPSCMLSVHQAQCPPGVDTFIVVHPPSRCPGRRPRIPLKH